MATQTTRVRWGAVALFVVLAYGLAWLAALPLWLSDLSAPSTQILSAILAPVMMLTPAIATIIVVFVMRAPRTHRARFLGLWPLRPAKRVVWLTVAALFGSIAIGFASVAVAALLGWVELDLVNFSGFVALNEAALPAGMEASVLPPAGLLIAVQIALMPIAAILPNSLLAFGEELGWRGWLLPALRPLGTWPALLLSGAIWGVWHAPLTLLGHNYGLFDWRGVALMTVNCVLWGVLFGWLRLRSGSVWPAVIAHGALNTTGGLVMLFAAVGSEVRVELVTVAGAAGWIVVALIVLVLTLTGQLRIQPELAPARNELPRNAPVRHDPEHNEPERTEPADNAPATTDL
ncbi:membrane protease YdiL (CAAX protease family) [Leucobacter exalbidus]|uniref:Membrane protease YdiL (CAAX protease family) n=1 Tax=Leucobacter exalbidus TaxID=662960 RepID=A0A940T341_9MICO|nr:CPBP family intramembrane glutamic endopeptidase [Leucobacter exalbidus]MBP1325757.1 membrane protease YdiL (CAAX protease family) [Leucobacter exalbidus]